MTRVLPTLRRSLSWARCLVDTESVVQQALLITWNNAPRIERGTKTDPLLAYALKVSRNEALKELPPRDTLPVDMDQEVPEPEVLSPLFRAGVSLCFDTLPERPKIALRVRIEDGGTRTDEELAQHLGMTKGTYQQNLHRARVTIQDCLRRHGIEVNP